MVCDRSWEVMTLMGSQLSTPGVDDSEKMMPEAAQKNVMEILHAP